MKDGKMAGFAVDLMDKISNKANFDYELYVTPDGSYGTPINGNASGMVGEVMHKVCFLLHYLVISTDVPMINIHNLESRFCSS